MTGRNILFLLTGLLLYSSISSAQIYSVSRIPAELKEDAYAVIRKNYVECEVRGKTLEKKAHYVITILDKSGDFLSSYIEFYDPSKEIKNAVVNLYNSAGKKVNTFRKKDFDDYSAINGFSLYEDSRVIYFKPAVNSYPYTVEYLVTTEEEDFISFPKWIPVPARHVSVEVSEYKLMVPEDYEIKYKFINSDKDFKVTRADNQKTFSVTMVNQNILEDEPYSPLAEDIYPHALVVPEKFSMEDYNGSYESWNEFGKWIWTLKKDRVELSEEVKQELGSIISETDTEKEKILKVYKYLQNSTRYVNISLGIGGYQPYPAMTVRTNGYGDCKALSNYAYAMLNSIGIKSYYTLVSAGSNERDIFIDFPSQQFNHVILCVPLEKDTIWLECTSQTSPPGYLGRSIDNRTVLLIDEDGGHLTRTSGYKPDDNLQLRRASITIDPVKGNFPASIHTEYRGQQYSYVESVIHDSEDDQKDFLLEDIEIPQFKINSFKISNRFEDLAPVGIVDLDLDIENYITRSGDRYFLPLNLMNKSGTAPKPDDNRINDIYLGFSYHDIDSIHYRIPDGLSVEYLPENVILESDFGAYAFKCTYENQVITVVREIRIIKGIYPRDKYAEFVEFFRQILKADSAKALLKE